MPKFSISIDQNFRRFADTATDVRHTIRRTVHQPHRRATTRTLFLTGLLAVVVCGGLALGLLR